MKETKTKIHEILRIHTQIGGYPRNKLAWMQSLGEMQ